MKHFCGLIIMSVLAIIPFSFTDAVVYKLDKTPIDVVIPCIEKDKRTLELCISGIKTYGSNIRRVIVVSPTKLTDNAEWFDEARYPFTKKDILKYLFKDEAVVYKRCGWLYQQLLKLYTIFVIPDISSNVLILDADTIFINPVHFYDENTGGALFCPNSFIPGKSSTLFYDHAKRLVPGLIQYEATFSGVAHHMLFQYPIMKELFDDVEARFKKVFWKAFCDCIEHQDLDEPCASEYEIYSNYALMRTKQCKVRPLKWREKGFKDLFMGPLKRRGFCYVTCHNFSYLA